MRCTHSIKAVERFLDYLIQRKYEIEIDNFAKVSESIFEEQDIGYLSGKGFRIFSMLTLALLQLGLLEEFGGGSKWFSIILNSDHGCTSGNVENLL